MRDARAPIVPTRQRATSDACTPAGSEGRRDPRVVKMFTLVFPSAIAAANIL
jgi:hypothetical protein